MEIIVPISIRYLQSKSYHFPQGWVEACLEWLFQEHKDEISSMSNDKWCHLIEQQWLFTDLRDLETINSFTISEDSIKFIGVICCQVMGFRVVSESCYSQIKGITGFINENVSVTAEPDSFFTQRTSSDRSLLLNLTDGINNFEAFEFERWNLIETSSIVMGCKCRLKGPFIVRRRVALLKQQNIEILGGEVEDLSSVTQLSVLQVKLESSAKRKDLPRILKLKDRIKATQFKNKQNIKTLMNDSQDVRPNNLRKENVKIKSEIENFPPIIENIRNNISRDLEHNNCKTSVENISQLSLSGWIKNSNAMNSFSNNIPQAVEQFDDEGEELLLNIPLDDLTVEPFVQEAIKLENQSCNEKSFHKNEPFVQEAIKMENQLCNLKPFDKKEPFVYLVDVFNELSQPNEENVVDKQFKIKGLIFTFTSKLKIVEDVTKIYRWDLQIVLGDGTATVDCYFADEFITNEIGFTAQQFQEAKKSKTTDSYKKSFFDFQAYIVKCNCGIFTLQICEGYDKLCVVNYQSIDEDTVKALRNRVSQMRI